MVSYCGRRLSLSGWLCQCSCFVCTSCLLPRWTGNSWWGEELPGPKANLPDLWLFLPLKFFSLTSSCLSLRAFRAYWASRLSDLSTTRVGPHWKLSNWDLGHHQCRHDRAGRLTKLTVCQSTNTNISWWPSQDPVPKTKFVMSRIQSQITQSGEGQENGLILKGRSNQ